MSPRERLGRIIGATPRARWASAATAVALVAIVAAFIALDPAGDGAGGGAYTTEADRACVGAKREIVSAGRRSLAGDESDPVSYAGTIVRATTQWRATVDELLVPGDRRDDAAELDRALLDVIEQAGTVTRAVRERDPKLGREASVQLAEATGRVEGVVDALGLERCGEIAVGTEALGQG